MVEEDQAAPPKEQLEQEKQLLLACKPVLQKFLHDHTQLQVSALYALQVHCHASDFPKGGSRTHARPTPARPRRARHSVHTLSRCHVNVYLRCF